MKKKQWGGKWTEEKLDAFEMATGFIIKAAMLHVLQHNYYSQTMDTVKYNGERVVLDNNYDPLAGYEVTLNGVADTKIETSEDAPASPAYGA